MKLRAMMRENIRRHVTAERIQKERQKCSSIDRRRQSIFAITALEKLVATQERNVPPKVKKCVLVFSLVAGIFFLVTGILAVSVAPDCDMVLWDECKVQVPLCTFHTLHDFMKYNLFTNKVHTLHGKK